MGMGLQIAVNIFSTLSSNTCKQVPVASEAAASSCTTWQRDHLMEADSGIQQLQESMDKLLEGCSSRYSIRNMMLRHEKIFKEQVLELHRLYKVQKVLMAQHGKESSLQQRVNIVASGVISDTRSGFWSSASNSQGSLSSSFMEKPRLVQSSCEFNVHLGSNSVVPSSGSLNISFGESYRLQEALKTEDASIHGCSGTSFPAILDQYHPPVEISPNDTHKIEDSDLELTLSLGGGSSRRKLSQTAHCKSELGRGESISDHTWQPASPSSHSVPLQEQGNLPLSADSEGLQQPSWFLHSLSLKRT